MGADKWEQILCDYPDQMLLQYLKFDFPLSPDQFSNTYVKTLYSATQYPTAVQERLHKEIQLGAILGPTDFVNLSHLYFSIMLTYPKDKCRVIMNL